MSAGSVIFGGSIIEGFGGAGCDSFMELTSEAELDVGVGGKACTIKATTIVSLVIWCLAMVSGQGSDDFLDRCERSRNSTDERQY